MAYNKHEWQNGELITPQLMNNIENGLEEVLGGNLLESLASSYDPSSTYQGGETVTYNNRLYRIIGNEVTGEWDSNNAEEIQLIPLLNRDGEITNNRIESLSTLLTYVMENIAEIYIPSKRHYTGDYVWYLYTLYRFIVDQPESDFHSFDSSEVEVVNVMDIFKEIINNSFGEVYSNTKSYSVGDYVLYKNKIYKCIENTIPGTFEDNFSRFSLTTITNELGNFNQVKTDIERDALTAEAYACGTQNGTAITDNTHPAFENNAKYYSDLISSDAELVEAYSIGKYKGEDITSTDSGEYADAYHNNAKYYYEQIANELELVSALFPEGYENLVSDIGTAFNSTSHTYHIGDYCVHDSKLYRCITEFTATNTWENGNYDSNFIEVNIGDELSIIKNGNSAIINSSITSNIAPEYNSQNTYDIGDYITYNNEFYRCINPITTTNNAWETISNNFIKINIAKELTSLKNITNNSAKEFILANSSYWIVGTLAVADGTPLDNTTMRLRYNGFLNMKGNMISIKTKNNYEFLIYAWNKSDNSYLGCLKTNGQFEKTTGSYLWLKEYNIASQPELKFKIVMRNATNTSAVMTPDDSVNCLCTRLDINNDIITYEFDPTQMWPYKAGEYVRYETQLYRFKVNHVGPWAAGDVERVNVGEELNNISAIAANYIAEPFDSEASYEGGDYITKEGKMYQITENSGLTSCETNVASELSKILNLIGVTTIPFVKGKFINTGANSETGLINTRPQNGSNWQYALVPCQPNDSFTITGTGSNKFHYLWSFMASDFSQIPNYNSGTSAVAENSVVVAPDNAAYLIVNTFIDQPALLCKGENLQAKFNNLSSAFLNYKLLQNDDNILELKNGVYRKNTGNTPINWPEVFPDNISSTYGTLISFVAASEYRILIYFPGRQASSIPLRQVNSCFLKIRSNGAWGDWLSFKIGTGKSVFNVNQEAIGSNFSVSNDYNDGDYVLNNGDLYKFNTSHFSEEWNSEDAEETSITNELSSLNDLINYVFTQTSSAISTEASNRQFFDNNEMMNRTTRDNELMYMMAPEHITNKAYSTGECVIHEGGLYEATTNVQAGTEFSSSNFTETTISSNILEKYEELENIIATLYNVTNAYNIGDYCTYEGEMYRCTSATSGAFDSSDWEQVLVGSEFKRVDKDVDDLKSAMYQQTDNAIDGVFVLPQSYVEQGSISAQGIPLEPPSAARIRTKYPVCVKRGSTFTFEPGDNCGQIYWFFFKDSGTLETSSNWSAYPVSKTIEDSGYLLFVFRRQNTTAAIVPSDYDASVIVKTPMSYYGAELSNVDAKINSFHNLINYDYDKIYDIAPNPGVTSASAVGIKREKNVFTLNTINAPSDVVKIKICGDMMRTMSSGTVDDWNGITLMQGHTYLIKSIPISGSSTAVTPNAISVYKHGSHASIGNSWIDGTVYYREFTYDDSTVNLAYVVASGATYTNYKCLVTLEDITGRENDKFELPSTIVDDYDATISTNNQGANAGIKLKVVSYNVAAYNNDTEVYISTSKEINFKKMLCEIAPDILAIQEDKKYITGNSGRLALTSLYNPIFPYEYHEQTASALTCTVRSKTPAVTHELLEYSTGRWIEIATYEINGKTLLFGSTHPVANYNQTGIDSEESIAARLVQYQELVKWLNGEITLNRKNSSTTVSCPAYDWCIMCGDYNTITATDMTNFKTIATNGGFKIANGDWLGWIETNYKFFDAPMCLDNVMVSDNVIFNSIISHSEMFKNLYSDHVPFEVTVTLQDE